MNSKLIRSLGAGALALALFAPQAKAVEIVGQIDMTGVARFNSPLATASRVTAWLNPTVAIATGTFAAGGVTPFVDHFNLQNPWFFNFFYQPLWTVTGSAAPNTTFTFDGLQNVTINQGNGFLEVVGSGIMKSSDPAYEDTSFTWRFTSQGTGSRFNRYSFSASAFRNTIPDGGLTLGLLGLALVTVEGLRRKFSR